MGAPVEVERALGPTPPYPGREYGGAEPWGVWLIGQNFVPSRKENERKVIIPLRRQAMYVGTICCEIIDVVVTDDFSFFYIAHVPRMG